MRVWVRLLGGFTVFLLVLAGIGIFGYYDTQVKISYLDKGIQLISEGRIEEGLKECKLSGVSGICYTTVLSQKVKNGEKITQEFCNEIPMEREGSFGISPGSKKRYKSQMEQLYVECVRSIN